MLVYLVDGQSVAVVGLGEALNLDAGLESDGLLFDELGVARRPLGAGQRHVLGRRRAAAPVLSLQHRHQQSMTTTGLDRERFHGVRGTKAGLTVTGKYQG